MKKSVCISLIAHTNVGKTTLCRTLLRRDVGIVADRANVTSEAEAWSLVELDDAVLKLWDTPGFGDSKKLVGRLSKQDSPIAWLLREVWDRATNKVWYDAQAAARNARQDADVIIYLVDGRLDPTQLAAYASPELELLQWIGCPVVLVVNQTGPHDESWQRFAESRSVIKDCLSLDAHTRCWLQEVILMRRLADAVVPEKRETMRRLGQAWTNELLDVHSASVKRVAAYIGDMAADSEPLVPSKIPGVSGRRALSELKLRLGNRTRQMVDDLIELHGLEGSVVATMRADLQDVHKPPEINRSLWTVVSSAAGGLGLGATTSLLAGGLDFGGGAVIGLAGGALSGWLLAQGAEKLSGSGEPVARWSTEYLDDLFMDACRRYLRVAHAGRGRGVFQDDQNPAAWDTPLKTATAKYLGTARKGWAERRSVKSDLIAAGVDSTLRQVLVECYPEGRDVWDKPRGS